MSKGNTTTASKKDAVVEGQKEVRFLLSPTGRFKLAYNAGDVASFNAEQAEEMIELGYAEEVVKE